MPSRHPILTRGIRILQTYYVDWVAVAGIAVFVNFYLERFQNIADFDLTDTTIQYAFKAKQVFPDSTLAYILVLSYVLVVISNLILSRNMWDLHHALLGLSLSFSIIGALNQITRISVGRPRPDFLSRCNPFDNATNAHLFGLANMTVCQTAATDPIIIDGMRSFFSGHACLSAAGLGFNSLYWAGKLQLFNQKAYTAKAFLVFAPLMASIYVCITRVTDHRHHWEDVTTGFFIGILLTYAGYRQFYPPLHDPHSDLPYAPRNSSGETPRSPSRTYRRQWFSGAQEQPTPLLPTNRSNRDMRGSMSNLGHVETELESGLIATPFNPSEHEPDMGYSGLPKPLDPRSSGY